ncbi:hypothetical protein M9M90_06960 [Phenylobacterium sp. LH3H17]|uniref:hypothetical protein n=1 Tax=Phenylobacterium sp. LH3H17 TaxID=2903901 RepID=UPI0020C9433B|nr:hypothetical protein [Phenylobacterium sp. LH3H17]UTP40915.1 hypothetical protein M9M90_06960 [Phenylobacterium sp. LH3H17]
MDFIDVSGASGATYRFRAWPDSRSHVPVAGNFVVIGETRFPVNVLVIGVTGDLSQARSAAGAKGGERVYTRLNVARATREAEHDDLVAHHSKARVVVETG